MASLVCGKTGSMYLLVQPANEAFYTCIPPEKAGRPFLSLHYRTFMRTSNAPGEEGYKIHDGLVLPVLLSAGSMFLASYVWHGEVLNDLAELGAHRTRYLLMSAMGYVLLGVLLTFLGRYLIDSGLIDRKEPPISHVMVMGLLVGVALGVAVHAMSLPFRGRFDAIHMLVDLVWQVAEQGIGGLFAGVGIFFHAVRLRLEREGAL
jgi:hypothetical protein